jgi:phosphatidylglycerophosphate synthase
VSSTLAEDTGFGASYRRLRDAQKTSFGAPLYSLVVNRPLGRVFAAAAFQVRATPNQVTAVGSVLTYAGILLVALLAPAWWVGLLVAVLLVLGYALDSADGQLARLRGGGSLAGEWLDHMFDAGKAVGLHMAVLVGWFRFLPDRSPGWLLVPIGFAVVSVVLFFGQLLNEQLMRVHRLRHQLPTPPKQAMSPLRSVGKLPSDYGLLCVTFVLLGLPTAFLTVYTLLGVATAGLLALSLVKWFGEMKAVDRGAAS